MPADRLTACARCPIYVLRRQRLAAVGTEYNIFRQERFQRNRQRCHVHCLQHKSIVAPARSRATSTGTCSCERPRWVILPPRFRALRSKPLRFLLNGQEEHRFVSLGASQCLRLDGLGCRQKAMPPAVCGAEVNSPRHGQSLAACSACAWSSHLPRLCNRFNGVPVRALNVLQYSRQR